MPRGRYVTALKLGWVLALDDASPQGLEVLSLQALTVFSVACVYIRCGTPISGVPGLPKDRGITREEADKAFHDTAVGQSIGVSFTPVFQQALVRVGVYGGALLEAKFGAPGWGEGASPAEAARRRQDWEIAASALYVILLITPLAIWVFYTFILDRDESKDEEKNAAAAADDGGGDDGGGD